MSHGAARTTWSIVGDTTEVVSADRERRDGRSGAESPLAWIVCRPPQPKISRSASSSPAASMIPSAACRAIRTRGWIGIPSGA
jgi:hypothetical protein